MPLQRTEETLGKLNAPRVRSSCREATTTLSGSPSSKSPATLTEKAPDTFKVNVDTTKGAFVIEVTRAWAPNGADRFYNLVKNGFYDQVLLPSGTRVVSLRT